MIEDEGFWSVWGRVESTARWLAATARLPDVELEIAQAVLFARFERTWQQEAIVSAEAWTRVTFGRILGVIRHRTRAVQVELEFEAPEGGESVCDIDGLRERCSGADEALRSKLSLAEAAVYACVRAGNSLKKAAARLGMSERDARTRFRRVLLKLDGILADQVPPPPHQNESRARWRTSDSSTNSQVLP